MVKLNVVHNLRLHTFKRLAWRRAFNIIRHKFVIHGRTDRYIEERYFGKSSYKQDKEGSQERLSGQDAD